MRPSIELESLIEVVEAENPDGTPLDHVTGAVLIADDLADIADDLIGHFVDLARESGASWAEVGEAIGVSKQAAQKRWLPEARPQRKRGRPGRGLFARFTVDARSVVIDAQQIARSRGDREIGSAHILLAVADGEEGARILAACGVDADQVPQALEPLPTTAAPRRGHIPFTADAKKLLQLALRETLRLGGKHIEVGHLLLGMLRDPDTAAGKALTVLGVTRESIEDALDD
jgi:hypothetical protein